MRRRNGDEVTRDLERRVLGGDLSAVVPLARLYERLGRGEDLRELTIDYRDGDKEKSATVVVAAAHPLAVARRWLAEPHPDAREIDLVDALVAAGFEASLGRTDQGAVADVIFAGDRSGPVLAFSYLDGPLGADLIYTAGHEGWDKDNGSTESDVAWAVRVAREVAARIASGEIRVPATTPAPPAARPGSVVTRAASEFADLGIHATIQNMGGNLLATGVTLALLPPGIHVYVADDPAGEAESVVTLGWDSPATEERARAILSDACQGDVIEDAGDDTIAFSGALWRVIRAAARIVFAHNHAAFCGGCGHEVMQHAERLDRCRVPGCQCQIVRRAILL